MAWNEAQVPRGMQQPARVASTGRNYTKTAMLMAFLVALLAIGGQVAGGPRMMFLFGGLGLLFNLGSYWFSDKLALMAHRAQPVTREQLPEVYEIVERLTRKAGLPMPTIHVIPSDSPNAFATGRNPEHAAVAVTEGILRILDRRQLEGVLAHELSHVRNRDILIATVAASIAGLIASLGYVIKWGAILGMGRDREGGENPIAALAWALLAPFIALIVQLAVSRSREYGADASGAELVGDPDPLADALLALERGNEARPYEYAGPATAHLFIVNPFSGLGGRALQLFSTHPSTEDRIARLRAMKRGVRYA